MLFTWPSNGTTYGYLPDREDARASAPDMADVFVDLHDQMTKIQRAVEITAITRARMRAQPKDSTLAEVPPCRAKISVIAHSMGNFVL